VALRSPTTASDGKPGVVGGADDLSYFIKRVTFKLHDTYPTPNRSASLPEKLSEQETHVIGFL
jgi:YEATS domain-containing protein 4